MTVRLVIEQASVDSQAAYQQRIKERIYANLRTEMRAQMVNLARAVLSEFGPAGIVQHTGDLAALVATSPDVVETGQVIRGTVSADDGKLHIGLWLEEGTNEPASEPGKRKLYGFKLPDGSTQFTRGHAAFKVRPHPILNPALATQRGAIAEGLQAAVNRALEGNG